MSDEQALKNIASNVTQLRGERSQYWLAKTTGTYPSNIARIEGGENMPGGGLLSRIADALGVSMDDLVKSPKATAKKTSKKLARTG